MSIVRHLPRFRKAKEALRAVAQRETWNRDEIAAFQLRRLNSLWGTAVQRVSHYQNLQRELGLPSRFTSLDEFSQLVPALDKELVRSAPDRFLAKGHAPGNWHRTGGSTGKPMKVFWPGAGHRENLLAKYRHDQQYELEVFDPKTFVWGHGDSFAPGVRGWLDRMRRPIEDRLRNRQRLSAYRTSEEARVAYLQAIAHHRSRSIYGYVTSVYLLAEEALKRSIDLPNLRLITLTAEPLYDSLTATIEDAFGVPAVAEYGSVECGVMATEWPDRTLRVRDDMCIIETQPQLLNGTETGRYDILTTVLTNHAFPLIRYAIGDVADSAVDYPDRGFAILGKIQGRSNDFLLSSGGDVVHPNAIKNVVEFVDAKRFQARQHADGRFVLKLERTVPLGQAERHSLETHLKSLLGDYPVVVEVLAALPSSRAGKHRWILSDLAPTSPSLEQRND